LEHWIDGRMEMRRQTKGIVINGISEKLWIHEDG
jgi:hypothetical protein